jgi:hypothetical protein
MVGGVVALLGSYIVKGGAATGQEIFGGALRASGILLASIGLISFLYERQIRGICSETLVYSCRNPSGRPGSPQTCGRRFWINELSDVGVVCPLGPPVGGLDWPNAERSFESGESAATGCREFRSKELSGLECDAQRGRLFGTSMPGGRIICCHFPHANAANRQHQPVAAAGDVAPPLRPNSRFDTSSNNPKTAVTLYPASSAMADNVMPSTGLALPM